MQRGPIPRRHTAKERHNGKHVAAAGQHEHTRKGRQRHKPRGGWLAEIVPDAERQQHKRERDTEQVRHTAVKRNVQKRQQQDECHRERREQHRGLWLQFSAQHRQKQPCTVVDKRRDQQRAEQRKRVCRARREHEERLRQQIDDQRRVVVEPRLVDGRADTGKDAVRKVGFQPHLQIIVGRVVPQIETLAPTMACR